MSHRSIVLHIIINTCSLNLNLIITCKRLYWPSSKPIAIATFFANGSISARISSGNWWKNCAWSNHSWVFFVAVFGKYLHLGMTSYKRINESEYLYFDICIYETHSMSFTQRIDVKESIANIHYYLVLFHFGLTSCPFQQSCKKESRLFKKRLVHTCVFIIIIIIITW